MNKLLLIIIIAALSVLPARAQTVITLPNTGLQIIPPGSSNWPVPINFNTTLMDQYLGGKQPLPNGLLFPFANLTTGLKLKGSYGLAGQTLQSTGAGSIWAYPPGAAGISACPGTSASGTDYVCAMPVSPLRGTTILFQADAISGAAPTLAVNGGLPMPIMGIGGASIGAGEFLAGQWILLSYTGTSWVIPFALSPADIGAASAEALLTEKTRALTAEGVIVAATATVQTNLDTEATTARAAESTNAAAIAAKASTASVTTETTRATAAEGINATAAAAALATANAATPQTTTVNGHPLSSNVVVSASDLMSGVLPHAQLPALVNGDIPSNLALASVKSPIVDLLAGSLVQELPNNPASGSTLNALSCSASVAGVTEAQTCTTASTNWSGIVIGGATGTTVGNTQFARGGQASCLFDGTTVFGDYVQISSTVAGDCHDSGSTTYPAALAVVGRVRSVNSGAGTTALVDVYSPGIIASATNLASPGPIGGTSPGSAAFTSVTLGAAGNTATGLQVPTANATSGAGRSVLAFGAVADYQSALYGCSTTLGSKNLNCNNVTFTPSDVGRTVLFWAGACPIPGTVQPNNGITLCMTLITGFTDATHVVMSQAATATLASISIKWGTDSEPALAACSAAGPGTCKVPAGQFFVASAPYYAIVGASDNGGYGTTAGGSGAVVTSTLGTGATAGQIASYTVTNGGSGYTINSDLQVAFSGGGCGVYGYNDGPCGGAYALAHTNGTGSVVSITPVYTGFGFTVAPTVAVTPLGGDLAAATAFLTGGSISSTTVTAGGSGYGANFDVFGVGGGCTPIAGLQNVTTVIITARGTAHVTSGAVTSITWSNAGTGCTTAPTVFFSDYVCGAGMNQQCTNLPPLTPSRLPVHIMTRNFVSWEGPTANQGNFGQAAVLNGVWDSATVDSNQPVMFAGGLYVSSEEINGLGISGTYIGIVSPFSFTTATVSNNVISAGICMYYGATDLGAQLTNNSCRSGYGGWTGGGTWNTRIDNINVGGGFYNSQKIDSNWYFALPYNATSKAIDDWFAATFWHPEYSANSPDFLETCKFPQTPNQRQTSPNLTNGVGGNTMCYPGITQSVMVELNRNGGGSNAHDITNSGGKYCDRYLYYGNFAGGTMSGGGGCEQGVPLVTDPYRTAAIQHAPIVTTTGYGSDPNTLYRNISWQSSGTTSNAIWGLGSPTGIPVGRWESVNVGGTTANPAVLNGDNINKAMNYTSTVTAAGGLIAPGTNPLIMNSGSGPVPSRGPMVLLCPSNTTQPVWSALGTFIGGCNSIASGTSGNILEWYNTVGGVIHTITTDGGITNLGINHFNGSTSFNSGTAVTGTVGTGGKLQETTTAAKTSGSPVAWDANGNTVNATAANLTGLLSAANITSLFTGCSGTQYLGADGACHTVTFTSAGIVALFTGCSGTQSLGADGACHTGAAYTLPQATTSVLGGVMCDGTTTTCTGGVISAAVSGAAFLTTTGGQSIAAANTTTGLTSGCVQYPCVITKGNVLSTSITNISTVFAPPAAGEYRYCYWATITVAGTSGSWSPSLIISSADGRSYSSPTGFPAVSIAIGTAGSVSSGCGTFYDNAASNINMQLAPISIVGTPTTRYIWTLEQLQ